MTNKYIKTKNSKGKTDLCTGEINKQINKTVEQQQKINHLSNYSRKLGKDISNCESKDNLKQHSSHHHTTVEIFMNLL